MRAKGESVARAYLLRGDDEFQKHQELEKLLKVLVSDDFADFDLERMEGDSPPVTRSLRGSACLRSGPGGGWCSSATLTRSMPTSRRSSRPGWRRLPQSGCLILVNPAAEKSDGKPKRGSEVIGELSRAVRKVGEVREIGGGQAQGPGCEGEGVRQVALRDRRKEDRRRRPRRFSCSGWGSISPSSTPKPES